MTITAPCKGCTKRQVGCHSKCSLYKDFKQQLEEINTKMIASKKAEYGYLQFKKKRKRNA